MDLPRFTFLCGRDTQAKRDLAKAIGISGPSIAVFRLSEICYWSVTNMIWGQQPASSAEVIFKILDRPYRITDFSQELESLFRRKIGPDALGQIALHKILNDGEYDLYDHFLIPDVVDTCDVVPFAEHVKPKELLCIYTDLGVSQNHREIAIRHNNHIWLASPSLSEQLKQLERELSWQTHPPESRSLGVPAETVTSASSSKPEATELTPNSDPSLPTSFLPLSKGEGE